MKTRIAALLVLCVTSAFAAETRDPAAVAVARRALEAMGGAQAFATLRTLKFDFVVERDGKEVARVHHVWDRWDGRYRIEGVNRDGKNFRTLFNVQQQGTGRSWLDGKELDGEALKKALERAYGRFINDTYWLLMPAKMQDPGVNLASEGESEKDGKTYDVVRLTFSDGVGLTPKDTYWAYVSKDSGLMERWEFVLTDQKAEDREAFLWTDWQTVLGVRLAMAKTAAGGGTAIRFDHVSGSASSDDSAFTP
jgi:uncharacterized protein DUF6503